MAGPTGRSSSAPCDYLAAEAGIRQFLDIGTGLPTADNTHEVAQRVAPSRRVVYVDNDPIVLAHARALLTSTPEGATDYIDADLRDPARSWPAAARTLDFARPVAVMLVGVLHLIQRRRGPGAIVDRLMDAAAAGQLPGRSPTRPTTSRRRHGRRGAPQVQPGVRQPPITCGPASEVAGFFDGLELVEPGVVPVTAVAPGREPSGDRPEIDYVRRRRPQTLSERRGGRRRARRVGAGVQVGGYEVGGY